RWQRRWFVLYDDGELTYSVDEHPETIPQAIIDMTKVLEVSTADAITSHPHSIAITAPERVTFVKGTCPEETKWWYNVLVAFPKSKVRVSHTHTSASIILSTLHHQSARHRRCMFLIAKNDRSTASLTHYLSRFVSLSLSLSSFRGHWTHRDFRNSGAETTKQGRHKRNATFPGGQATAILQAQSKYH
uniref:PH domain-containing protein n=1 Tax=Anopheles albimanus TaxID=7167 RepID=A0A182F2E9_ANOAL